jgi:hypothetical protein
VANQAKQGRFLTLDGLRGFAAVCVAPFHYDHDLMPGGCLAVDFFFARSGFVLTKTYTRRFAEGLTKGAFFKQRAVRLFPTVLANIALAVRFVDEPTRRVINRWLNTPQPMRQASDGSGSDMVDAVAALADARYARSNIRMRCLLSANFGIIL